MPKKRSTRTPFSLKKEIFINRGLKTTYYSVGKMKTSLGRIHFGKKADALKCLKRLNKRK